MLLVGEVLQNLILDTIYYKKHYTSNFEKKQWLQDFRSLKIAI